MLPLLLLHILRCGTLLEAACSSNPTAAHTLQQQACYSESWHCRKVPYPVLSLERTIVHHVSNELTTRQCH